MSLLGGGGREEVKSLSSLASVSSSSSAHLALLGGGREWRVRNGSTNSPQRSVYPVDALTLAATTYTHNQSGSCPQTVGIESAPSVKPWRQEERACACVWGGGRESRPTQFLIGLHPSSLRVRVNPSPISSSLWSQVSLTKGTQPQEQNPQQVDHRGPQQGHHGLPWPRQSQG